jgi:histidine triad (HIT) family protein
MWDARGALPAVCLAALATVPLWWIMGRAKRANSDVVDEQEQAAKRSRGTAAAPGLHVLSYAWKPDNVFAGIQSGSIPAEKVFDVEHTFAILDHSPVSRGHCLVITKHPVSTLCQGLPAEALAATLRDVQVLTKAVQAAVGAAGVQVMQNNGPAAGQTVPQLHFHVVPVEAPVLAPQQQQQQQQAERPTLTPEESGPLLASIRNALPADYSGGGCHAWIPSAAAMEDLGASLLSLCIPGTVVCLSGHLGTGKSSIARGTVRAFCGDPDLFVPSPTFLLNLSYTADTAHEAQPEAAAAQLPYAAVQSVHHMDPYRLGNADKMAGLIDFAAAFQEDICLIEWPERMPASVLALPRRRTLQVRISGSGAQAAGRLVHIWCSDEPCGGSSGSSGGGVGPASKTAAGRGAGGAGKGGGPRGPVVAAAAATEVRPEAATAAAPVAVAGAANSDAGQQEGPAQDAGHADVHAVLQQWRQSGIPPPSVTWRAASTTAAEAAAGGNGTSVPGPGALSSSRGGQQVVLEGPPESWVVLGIESSCDDTAAAVVRGDGQVLAHKIASQVRRGGGGGPVCAFNGSTHLAHLLPTCHGMRSGLVVPRTLLFLPCSTLRSHCSVVRHSKACMHPYGSLLTTVHPPASPPAATDWAA